MDEKKQALSRRSLLGAFLREQGSGQLLGRAKGVLLEPESREVLALLIQRQRGAGREERILPWSDLIGWQEGVLLAAAGAQPERKGQSARYIRALRQPQALLGARVFSSGGHSLGRVTDYGLALQESRLLSLSVSPLGQPNPAATELVIPGEDILASSAWTVMVREGAGQQGLAEEADEKGLPQTRDAP